MNRLFAILPLLAAAATAQSLDITVYGDEYGGEPGQHLKLDAHEQDTMTVVAATGGEAGGTAVLMLGAAPAAADLSLIGFQGWLLVDRVFASAAIRLDADGGFALALPTMTSDFAKHDLTVFLQVIAIEKGPKGPELALSNGLRFDFARAQPEEPRPVTDIAVSADDANAGRRDDGGAR